MAVTAKMYGNVIKAAFNKEIDWVDDDIRVMATTNSYTPDQDAHDYYDDITNEVSGTGYTANGVALASKTITYTGGTNKAVLDAADAQWANATITVRNLVVYDRTPASDATRPLICYQASDADIIASGGNFDVVWNAGGICEFTLG